MSFNPNLPRIEVNPVLEAQLLTTGSQDIKDGTAVFSLANKKVKVSISCGGIFNSDFSLQASESAPSQLSLGGYEQVVPDGSKATFSVNRKDGVLTIAFVDIVSIRGRKAGTATTNTITNGPRSGSMSYVTNTPSSLKLMVNDLPPRSRW